ncbi:MAG TPA: hypothetical protein VK497_03225 [Candidatus Saccharimonadales bacterium]|nr:hypothetical protein [Candidatus Saccharimonadales bacterium]
MSDRQEQDPSGKEQKIDQVELDKEREKRLDKLREDFEKIGDKPVENAEDLHREAVEKAANVERKAETEQAPSHEKQRRGPVANKKELDASYNAKMADARTHMSAPSRTFSKVIHNKAVEKVSGVVGSTVARPNAILSGAVFAFVLTLAVYLVAKNIGYPLSGFETIGAFILGWVLGILYDFFKVMITGRK